MYKYAIGRRSDNFSTVRVYEKSLRGLMEDFLHHIYEGTTEEIEYSALEPFTGNVIIVAIDQSRPSADHVRGFASLSITDEQRAELDSAFVMEEDRGSGVWSYMTDMLIKEADKLGIKEIYALPFFQSEFLRKSLKERGFMQIPDENEMILRR